MKQILNINSNAKTVKNQKMGTLTGILYLAPHKIAGKNICPHSTKECRESCLYSAGRGGFNSVQLARIAKTNRFHNDPYFLLDLIDSINAIIRKSAKLGLVPSIRLNGTSDINWNKVLLPDGNNIFETFPNVTFYNYTKDASRLYSDKNTNHFQVLSYSGTAGNINSCMHALENGHSIAVVFKSFLPKTFMGKKVIDGDKHDAIFMHEKNCVIGLLAKGKAKKENKGSKFVIQN